MCLLLCFVESSVGTLQGTPSCMIERLYAKVDMGMKTLGSEFTAFFDHMEGILETQAVVFGKQLRCGHLEITCVCEQRCNTRPSSQGPAKNYV